MESLFMNLPNKITLSRIFLIPVFILILSIPVDWGAWNIGATDLPVTHFIAGMIFLIASLTDGLDGYFARKSNLITNMRPEEHTSELQSRGHLECRLRLEKKNDRTTQGRVARHTRHAT